MILLVSRHGTGQKAELISKTRLTSYQRSMATNLAACRGFIRGVLITNDIPAYWAFSQPRPGRPGKTADPHKAIAPKCRTEAVRCRIRFFKPQATCQTAQAGGAGDAQISQDESFWRQAHALNSYLQAYLNSP